MGIANSKYICMDLHETVGYGETMEDAFSIYKDNGGENSPDDVCWFEAKSIDIVVKIEKKTITETKITRK